MDPDAPYSHGTAAIQGNTEGVPEVDQEASSDGITLVCYSAAFHAN
jgi:hypothetical protein